MIKNIVFDIGDVILNFDFKKVVDEFTNDLEKKEFFLNNILTSPSWQGFTLIDYGYLTIGEAISIVQDNTNYRESDLVEKVFKNYFLYSHINKKVLDLIKKLRKEYKIYLLSNINEHTFNFIKTSGLFEIVDGYILSFEEHKVKPNEGIYKKLLAKYGLTASESLFIDDNLRNIKTAKRLNFEVIHVLPNNYDNLIDKLNEKINANF